MASLYLSCRCSEDNLFFLYFCPSNCPISPLSQKVSPPCRMWHCRFTVFNHYDPWKAAPACASSRSATLGSLARGGVSGAGLGIPPAWAAAGRQVCHGIEVPYVYSVSNVYSCLLIHMFTGERKNWRKSHLDPLVLQNECLAAEGILILTMSLRWVCLHGGAQRTGQCK